MTNLTNRERAMLLLACMKFIMDTFDAPSPEMRKLFPSSEKDATDEFIKQALAGGDARGVHQNEFARLMRRLYDERDGNGQATH